MTTTITTFVDAIRNAFPGTIRQATAGEVEQLEDRELVAWTDGGEAAFEISLSIGASYLITIKQTAPETAECERCMAEVIAKEIDALGGICAACFAAIENAYDVPDESPYDHYRGMRRW